jgi:hypothetical protein
MEAFVKIKTEDYFNAIVEKILSLNRPVAVKIRDPYIARCGDVSM